MKLATVFSRAHYGTQAPLIRVEVHVSDAKENFSIVGLPETVVKESRERVRSSILTAQFNFPKGKITVNLSPADLPKEGGRFDLPIALGILLANGQLPHASVEGYEFLGELSLDGTLHPIPGVLSCALANAREGSGRALILPVHNAPEATLAEPLVVYPALNLMDVVGHLKGFRLLSAASPTPFILPVSGASSWGDIIGQTLAKRALEIAAAGGHHLLMQGPPGVGKTLLAHCMPSLLPPLSKEQALEVLSLYQLRSGESSRPMAQWLLPPFRAPHHSASHVALVGGGRPPQPGEISLAHHGVLFLDEFPEFPRASLEALREPLEQGQINIARANHHLSFPARFQLIAAMNPCPCGYHGDASGRCTCPPLKIKKYIEKISGPLWDRIDLCTTLQPLPNGSLFQELSSLNEPLKNVQQRIAESRTLQLNRQGCLNAQLNHQTLKHHSLPAQAQQLLNQAEQRWHLSPRTLHRTLKVARTIADLHQSESMGEAHVAEALRFRHTPSPVS